MQGYIALWIIGLVFVAGAAVGVGLKALGMEIPAITSGTARAVLALIGVLAIVLGVVAYQAGANLTTTSPEGSEDTPTTTSSGTVPEAPPSVGRGQPLPQPAPTAETNRSNPGGELYSCSIDFSKGYSLIFGDKCPQPTQDGYSSSSRYDLYYFSSDSSQDIVFKTSDEHQLAVLDAKAASYQGCQNDTRYANSLSLPEGAALCFTGHGVIVGIKIDKFHSHPTEYVTLDIAVWQGESG